MAVFFVCSVLFLAGCSSSDSGQNPVHSKLRAAHVDKVDLFPPEDDVLLGALDAGAQAAGLVQLVVERSDPDRVSTVGELVKKRSCTTERTRPLNAQIAMQMNCIRPGFFASIQDFENVELGPAANPILQKPAADALQKMTSQRSKPFVINSSWRSVAQQHILKRWQGSCGIGIAADPGTSHHESGLAIDVTNKTTQYYRKGLKKNRWEWYCDRTNRGRFKGCRDTPHHTYKGGVDLRRLGVRAFQQLWNHAHPDDQIAESGRYDRATRRRLNRTPVEGFLSGATCKTTSLLANLKTAPKSQGSGRYAVLARHALEWQHVRSSSYVRPVPIEDHGVAPTSSPTGSQRMLSAHDLARSGEASRNLQGE